jgi:RecB family endonuclease NucS
MSKRFNVAIPRPDGGFELHSMKKWLRENLRYMPPGLDASQSTSHQIRSALRKAGWTVQELEDEVRLILPGAPEASVDLIFGDESPTSEGEESPDQEAYFELEYQLRDFLAQNLSVVKVANQKLSLYRNDSGRSGIEFPTDVGFIDILATDQGGNYYVFELKRGRSPDHAIGQLARYMGWVRRNLANGKVVNGIIVARAITDPLRYAAEAIPNVRLYEYEVAFTLNAAELPKSDSGTAS